MPAHPARESSHRRVNAGSLRRAFEQCGYRVQLGRREIELRVGEPVGCVERLLPRCRAFSVITAWNPLGAAAADRDNRAADRRLAAWLTRAGLPHWRAVNGEGRWREPSWLVGNPPLQQLDQLAIRLGQLATLHWLRGGVVRLRWQLDPGPLEPGCMDAGRVEP